MSLARAYSTLDIKSIDAEQRIIEGIASTPSIDRSGDLMDPLGAQFVLPMPFKWQHGPSIGEVFHAHVTPQGIYIKAKISTVDDAAPDALKNRINLAWHSIIAKPPLVRGLSIGWKGLESAPVHGKRATRWLKWIWGETSAVDVPMNTDATITAIKSLDAEHLAASGTGQGDHSPAGVSASPVSTGRKGARFMATATKTYSEQITDLSNKRAAHEARMAELQQTATSEGRTKDDAEKEEFGTLRTEIKQFDEELVDLRELETMNIAKAVPIVGTTPKAGTESRGSVITFSKSNLPKGAGFVRYVMALAAGRGSRLEALEFAKRWESTTPEVVQVLKAAVTAGTTTDSTWAAPLVVYQNLASEFIELLREATIIGRLQGFRRVPFNVTMPRQTSGSTVGWVGQAKPKPVGALAFDQVSLGMAKVAGIVVVAEELARSSNPSAEAIVSQDLRDAITKFMDTQFIDPAVAAVANVSPAAVTNGATVIDSTGVTAAALRADFASALAVWTAAEMSIAGGAVVMTESQAIRLSMIVNAFGQPEFPGMSATGGILFGLPVVASENVPAEGGSPAGNRIVLLKPGEILLADDGGITIDVSREASVQMNTTPDDPASASTVMTSFWQNNLVGVRAERFANWLKRRTAAAVVIEGAVYTG